MYYTYVWLRENGTPYYVGKGKKDRAFTSKKHNVKCPPKERIVIYPAASEVEALETEVALVWYYGRKDLGTGCLRNRSDGGDKGASGYKHTARAKEAIGAAAASNREAQLRGAATRKGRPRSEITKQKIREKLMGHCPSAESREKDRLSHLGKPRKHESFDSNTQLSCS